MTKKPVANLLEWVELPRDDDTYLHDLATDLAQGIRLVATFTECPVGSGAAVLAHAWQKMVHLAERIETKYGGLNEYEN